MPRRKDENERPIPGKLSDDRFGDMGRRRDYVNPGKLKIPFDGQGNRGIVYLETDVEGNELFYIFTPSQSTQKKDTLFLLLNGGQGSSSLEVFISEIGPVLYNYSQDTFILNEYAWNKSASIFIY